VLPYLSALENAIVFKGTLQMSTFTYLLYLYFLVSGLCFLQCFDASGLVTGSISDPLKLLLPGPIIRKI